MEYEGITLEKKAGVATIKLNRPEKLNAISAPMMQSIKTVLDEIHNDESVRVFILTGEGRAFCAGGDLTASHQVRGQSRREFAERTGSLAARFFNLPKPIIGAINGLAFGGGLSLAMLCDIRIASEKATFSSAYARIGMMPDLCGTYTMPRLVGLTKAMELVLTADVIDAAEALRIGLVNKVVPEAELAKSAGEMAKLIASGSPVAAEHIKLVLRRSLLHSFEEQMEFESFGCDICKQSEDHAEGVKAFLEKRKPVFKGK
ncbi:enoyl-CoA hydratase/isomerase family protein [Chloroflexota bacterium]